jgi:hypothetical protein
LLHETPDRSCLGLTTDLFAAATVTSAALLNEPKTRELYGRTLQSINDALRHPTESLEDYTIIAVWMIGNYEVSPHCSTGRHADPGR